MVLLYVTLGYSALIGGVVILLLSPLQYKLAQCFSGIQKKTLVSSVGGSGGRRGGRGWGGHRYPLLCVGTMDPPCTERRIGAAAGARGAGLSLQGFLSYLCARVALIPWERARDPREGTQLMGQGVGMVWRDRVWGGWGGAGCGCGGEGQGVGAVGRGGAGCGMCVRWLIQHTENLCLLTSPNWVRDVCGRCVLSATLRP